MQWTCFIWALNATCKKQMQRSFTSDWRSGIFGVADCWLKHCVTLRHRPQISSYGPRELTRCNWSCQHLRRPAVETILPDLCKSISRLAALTMAKQEQWKRSDKYIYRSAKQAGKGWKKKRDYEKKKDWKNKWHRLRVQRREGKYKRIDRLRQKKKKKKKWEKGTSGHLICLPCFQCDSLLTHHFLCEDPTPNPAVTPSPKVKLVRTTSFNHVNGTRSWDIDLRPMNPHLVWSRPWASRKLLLAHGHAWHFTMEVHSI